MIFYNFFVKKNSDVQREYERYVMENIENHKKHRLAHWKLLFKLNWHYRVKKKKEPLLYNDELLDYTEKAPDNVTDKKPAVKVESKVTKETTKKEVPKKEAPKNEVVKKEVNNVKKEVKAEVVGKLPYLDGAESELFKRKSPHYACRALAAYDIISYDIFDTLVFRPFSKPADLFIILGERLKIQNFKDIRVKAEQEAREKHNVLYGNTEIQISEIYDIIEKLTGIDKEYGIKKEIELELEFVRPNPYCKRVFDLLKEQGKRIIACSDMYLPRVYIEELLKKCGYEGFEEIYVSCEYTFSKRNGGMYKMLKKKYSGCSMIHMGDNYNVDVVSAKENGLEAIFSKNVNIAGMQYRAENMSPLIGSAYAGMVNMHLHNGLFSYTPHYEYGYIYGGIYILGYCGWIYRHAKKNNIDRVLFLSRDGYIYKKVFDYLYPDMKTEYVYWSRIAGQKYAFKHDLNDFITKMVTHKINNPIVHDTIGDLLDILSLSELKDSLSNYRLTSYEELSNSNKENLIKFFNDNLDVITELRKKELEYLKKSFKAHIGDSKKISIVDVGWIGSGPLGIKYLLNEVWKMDIKVHCLVAANRHYNSEANAISIINEDVESYLFNSSFNVELLKRHSSTNRNTNNLYFEQFTQASMPSYEGVDKDGNWLFDLPEIENYELIEEIHNGIFDFAKEYKALFGNYDYMFNISGHDAYMPFAMIVKNLKFIKTYLGKMTYSRTVGSNKGEQKIETLKEILDSLEL